MLEKLKLDLQLFADGGDGGGDGGTASASAGETEGKERPGENDIPASIPEKAKKYYQKAMAKATNKTVSSETKASDVAQTTNAPNTTEKRSYEDLIKSEYKDEHKAYMDKAISDRLKKYKGIEENLSQQKALLDTVATKYGVNPEDENFLEVLSQKIEADDSYYENYAMEHDITAEEARRIVTMERKAAQYDAEKEAREKEEQARQHVMRLRQNAEKTKLQFPDFDLDTAMQDERFRRLCVATNGDTTAAFMACHGNEIIASSVQRATRQVQAQTAQAVASNKARPIENGISSTAPSVVSQDFRKMNLQQIREFAEEQRRQGAKR
jgi:hypothetical protein